MDSPNFIDQQRSLVRALATEYAKALVDGEAEQAEIVVREAMAAGLTGEVIADQVIAPSMRRIGDLWAGGMIGVADEHLATHITMRVLVLQREAFRVAHRRGRDRVMLAGMEGEQHVVALEMAGGLLAQAGYDVRLLGPDVPVESLGPIVRKHRPRVFGLSATMGHSGALVRLALDELRGADPDLTVLVGGQSVPPGIKPTDWLVVTQSVAGIVDTVDALVRRPALN